MNQIDREFIAYTVSTQIKSAFTEQDKKLDIKFTSLKEELSNEISELAYMTAKGFERVDRRFEDVEGGLNTKIDNLESNMNSKFDGVNRRIDDLATNRVKNEIYEGLEKRVKKLEKVCV